MIWIYSVVVRAPALTAFFSCCCADDWLYYYHSFDILFLVTLVNWSPGSRAVELWSFFSRLAFHPPPRLLYWYWANAVSSSSSIIPNSTGYASFILVSIKCNHGSFTALNVPPIIGFQAGMTLLPAIHCDIWWLTIRGVQWQGSWVQMWSSPGHRDNLHVIEWYNCSYCGLSSDQMISRCWGLRSFRSRYRIVWCATHGTVAEQSHNKLQIWILRPAKSAARTLALKNMWAVVSHVYPGA